MKDNRENDDYFTTNIGDVNDFMDKHHLSTWDTEDIIVFLSLLDDLYLQLTPEQVNELVFDYLMHADEIWNSSRDIVHEQVERYNRNKNK